jgi:hypothetical protein
MQLEYFAMAGLIFVCFVLAAPVLIGDYLESRRRRQNH